LTKPFSQEEEKRKINFHDQWELTRSVRLIYAARKPTGKKKGKTIRSPGR